MNELPPDWAIKKAMVLIYGRQDIERNVSAVKGKPDAFRADLAFARYIAEHEEPPIDPDLEAAREWIVSKAALHPNEVRLGLHDDGIWIRSFLAGVKHGRGKLWPL